ncbi:carbon-nitrogen hydrolase family protein [Vibrio ostreicida]|uniref:Carbon-nitrogen hydrolase family protein n=1 Tax=Vibrio ostreicida TaxID=526588 RepID=A0ABT8BNJ0_9VIBR|nr:carbon-nitrogen hydrolase family protein [Vibrio ostreicida]MDN3608278.1 carbon-nitrogen hydrolase family protein [Vibrio ostreicida]NPD09738.1 carbon-nitrogen hydrolase family protein [Vibrio ostreicida]
MKRVGLIQMTSGPEPHRNLAYLEQQVNLLAQEGVKLVVTPENCVVFGQKADYHQYAEPLGTGPIQHHLAQIASDSGVFLAVGSMPIRRDKAVSTTSLLIDPCGELLACYDKLHMFDVDVADNHQRYRESEVFQPGQKIVTVDTPVAHLGMTICYDVRFPQLYNELAQLGANVILVPAAFTKVTGQAHWEPLLRARAIETQSWVIAVNQTGTHQCGRETWGHSMVVSPWGEIIASLNSQPQNLVVDIDPERVKQLRKAMPVLNHNRFTNQLHV